MSRDFSHGRFEWDQDTPSTNSDEILTTAEGRVMFHQGKIHLLDLCIAVAPQPSDDIVSEIPALRSCISAGRWKAFAGRATTRTALSISGGCSNSVGTNCVAAQQYEDPAGHKKCSYRPLPARNSAQRRDA
jgi:hypothetical protein